MVETNRMLYLDYMGIFLIKKNNGKKKKRIMAENFLKLTTNTKP